MRPELVLAPDWDAPADWIPPLAAFVAAADPEADARLWLDVGDARTPPGALVDMIGAVCEWAGGGGDFAEVVVADGDAAERPRAHAVRRAADVLAVLGADAPRSPDGAAAVVARAKDAKALVDRVVAIRDRALFEAAPDPWTSDEPLVSVRIPTWHGHELLVSRAIPSVLGGTYANVEVVVCSDGPDPAARAAVASVGDPRVRYVEVPERPGYARHFQSFWMTAGSMSANGALDACRGQFIAPLDHDDAFTATHVADLLAAARDTGADFVYGQGACEMRGGPWSIIGSAPLELGRITHGSVLHSRRLAHLRFDPHCWLLGEPGDWNLWRRMAATGASVAHLPRVVFIHFREKTSIEDRSEVGERELGGPVAVGDEDLARDLLGTDARWLLAIPRRVGDRDRALGPR